MPPQQFDASRNDGEQIMQDEWIPWVQGREIANSSESGKDGVQWAKRHNVPFMQASKHGRVFVSKLACEQLSKKAPPELELRPMLGVQSVGTDEHRTVDVSSLATSDDSKRHPDSYDIHVKVTVSHDLLKAILSSGSC